MNPENKNSAPDAMLINIYETAGKKNTHVGNRTPDQTIITWEQDLNSFSHYEKEAEEALFTQDQ